MAMWCHLDAAANELAQPKTEQIEQIARTNCSHAFLIMATAVISFLVILRMPGTYRARFASAAVTAP